MRSTDKGRLAMLAKGRLKRGEMNDTEKAYAAFLNERQLAGDVVWWKFEGLKFRLADGTFYVPDFAVMLADCTVEIHEVKGHWEGDAKLKVRVAADQYPFRFLAIQSVPRSRGGGWQAVDFSKDDAPLLPGMRDKAVVPPPVKRGTKPPAELPPRRKRRPAEGEPVGLL